MVDELHELLEAGLVIVASCALEAVQKGIEAWHVNSCASLWVHNQQAYANSGKGGIAA